MKSKRIFGLAAALMLSVVVTGGLWAQEFKLDGYLNSGLGIVANDIEESDAYLKAFGVDGESNGYRFRLNGVYTNEAKNAGGRFRLQSQRNLGLGVFSLAYAYGWVGFLENKVTLTGGIVDDSTWQTADWWFNDDLAEGLGLLVKATPIDGLNLGFGMYTITQQTGGSNNILSFNGALPNFGSIMPRLWEAKYTAYASYTMPDTFRFGLGFRNKNKTMWRPVNAAGDYSFTGDYEPDTLLAELRILAVKDLTAVVVGVFDYLGDFDTMGNVRLSETFGYKMDNLSIGLNAVQFLYSRSDDRDPGLLFNPWVSYAIDKVVPRLDLVFFAGGQSKMATTAQQWERRGFVSQGGGFADADDDYSVFSIRPSVKINLDSRIFLEIGDMLNIDFANFDGYRTKASGAPDRDTMVSNVFYVDVKFSF
ncbi:MAG: hypothetical protein FWG46_08455 [Treponema sp.]|nr:hypothetical protein [Treponema sp.]